MVNGYALTGANILGQNYQGGNYWFNYGATPNPYGFIPYVARVSSPTGTAEIGLGGDFAPLSPYGKVGAGIYHVTFTETGAGVGNWTTRIFNVPVIKPLLATTYFTNPSNTTVISASVRTSSFWLPNGTYTWTNVLTTSIQATGTTSGSVTVNGAATGVSNTLVQLYPARGTETGLVSPNVRWYVNVTGLPSATSTAATNIYYLPNGTYTYTVAAGANLNYHTNITGGSFVVASHVVTKNVTVTFTPVTYAVTFTETGLPASTLWYVNGTGQVAASSTVTTLTAQFLNGTIAYTIATANKNYAVNAIHATIVVAGAPLAGPTLAFSVFSGNVVTFFEGPPGLPVNAAWAVGLNGGVFGTTGAMFQFPTYNGTSTFTISAPPGYTANRTSGSLTVHGATGAGATTEIGFTATGYAVTYTEVGLVPGTSWSVTLNSVVHTSTTNTISFTETTGTYSYTIGAIAGTAASPSSGTVTVTNVPVSVAITYSSVSYTVSFTEGGTYAGPWAVQLGGVLKSAASGTISFTEPNGTYAYMVASVAGYTAAPSSGSIPVAGSGSSTSITFSTAAPPTYSLQFTENGLVLGTSWSVTVTGQGTLSSTGTTITFSALVAGTYTYSYGAVAGFTTPTGGAAVITTASVSLAVTYSAPTFAVTFTESGLPSGTAWAVAFAGQITVTTGTSIVFHVAAGTYSYSVATTSGYAPSPASGTLIVSGATPVAITYTLIPPVPSALSASTPVAVSARSD
jgi:hypothetical protein